MTNTSPVAKLTAGLPKGHGLARAVPTLFEQRGALVPFIGLMKVEECGLDADDVQHLRGSIARFEMCMGDLERDGKDLLARAAYAANAYPGQMTLMAAPGTVAALAEDRDRHIGYLREWQKEQDPPVSDADAAKQWADFSGGFYNALDQAHPAHLREFLLNIGALKDELVNGDDDPVGDGAEPDDEADADAEPAEKPAKKTTAKGKVVPFQPPAGES